MQSPFFVPAIVGPRNRIFTLLDTSARILDTFHMWNVLVKQNCYDQVSFMILLKAEEYSSPMEVQIKKTERMRDLQKSGDYFDCTFCAVELKFPFLSIRIIKLDSN